jgi:hypothetical protein
MLDIVNPHIGLASTKTMAFAKVALTLVALEL